MQPGPRAPAPRGALLSVLLAVLAVGVLDGLCQVRLGCKITIGVPLGERGGEREVMASGIGSG